MALGNYQMHATMFNTFAPDMLNSLQNKKMCTCALHQLQIIVFFSKTLSTVQCSQFKMQIYGVRSTVVNALSLIRYLFVFTLFVFSHQ